MSEVQLGFILENLMIPIEQILPSRKITVEVTRSRKFEQIRASIKEIGLIEPLSLSPRQKESGPYLLLDGHVRLTVLKELGNKDVPCLIAKDNEAYTYNNRINRLSTIQEHYMIKRAVERGVSKERLARALSVEIGYMEKKINLLNGICPEAAELLADRQFSPNVTGVIRKMKPTRQIECVELMVSADNVTVVYAEALLVATPVEMLVGGKKPEKLKGVTQEQMQRMEKEMANLQGRYKLVEQTYSQDTLELVLVRAYLSKLMKNDLVVKHLKRKHPEFMEQFQSIIDTTSLESAVAVSQPAS